MSYPPPSGPYPGPYPQQPIPPAPPQRHASDPFIRKRWVIGVAALLVGLIIGAASASSAKKTAAGKVSTVTATATATQSVAGPTTVVTTTPVVQKVIATRTHVVTHTYTPPPVGVFSDGTYKVGPDIKPGDYRTDGNSGGCYYERDRDLNGGVDSIINNDNFDGPSRISVSRGEFLTVKGGCEWRRA